MIDYNDLTKNIKDGLKFPTGATSERGNPSKGSLRFNSETGKPEIYAKSRGWKTEASSDSSAAYITTDLVVDLDAGNPNSYSGSGNTWTDLKGNTNYTWQNKTGSPTHDSSGWINSGGNGAWLGDSPFPYLSGNDYTLDIWFKYNAYTSSHEMGHAFSSYGSSNSARNITLSAEAMSKIGPYGDWFYFKQSHGGQGNYMTAGSLLDWYNIVIISKTNVSTSSYFYVNGVERNSPSGSTTGIEKSVARLMTLGGITSNNGSLTESDSSIASFRVYDKQLSATEVADNFNNTKSRFGL